VTSLYLFLAALVGGALNAVAGGGSFIGVPALLSAGIAPVAANATTTLAMWPGSLSSALAYRREIVRARHWLVTLGAASLAGGLIGGWLLIRTPDQRFLQLLPWLMFAAAITFTLGGRVASRLSRGAPSAPSASNAPSAPSAPNAPNAPNAPGAPGAPGVPAWILLFQLVIAIYGGYFGGGMGIMMLAAFSVAGMTDIHEMNGIKTLLAVAINGVALVEFIANGALVWAPGLIMVAGGIVGGYYGAFLARKIEAGVIRAIVIVIAWTMTMYFFVR
jgi:uncharacterized membrane protein YfcA